MSHAVTFALTDTKSNECTYLDIHQCVYPNMYLDKQILDRATHVGRQCISNILVATYIGRYADSDMRYAGRQRHEVRRLRHEVGR